MTPREGEEIMSEVFRTHEGKYRILVEHVIDGEVVDWHLREIREVPAMSRDGRHGTVVCQWLGKDIEWLPERTTTGFTFAVKK
jgi:hypothetical protein